MHSKNKLDQNFEKTIKLFNKNKINYWLCHGTLLGIIRDKQLIPWDHDIDIAVWNNKKIKNKILSLMKKNNFILKKKFLIKDDLLTFTKLGGREVDINFYKIKIYKNNKIAFVEWFIPKNTLCKIVDILSFSSLYKGKFNEIINCLKFLSFFFQKIKVFLINKKLFYKSLGYTQPISLLQEFKKIRFNGLEVIIPKKSKKYLKYLYGNSWQIKKKKFNWIKDSPSTTEL